MFYRISAFLLSAAVLTGCGGDSGPRKVAVSGTVTFDGKLVDSGEIVLRPATGNDPAGAGQIVAGKFECMVTPGTKKVYITAWREVGGPKEGLETGESGGESEQYIPTIYNDESELTTEIAADGSDDVVFELQAE